MANNSIKGITIAIGGDTVGLQDALKDVNKKAKDTQKELSDVEKALKFDPGNTDLIIQRQELLSQSIQQTSEKLQTLRTAQAQVEEQFSRGDISAEQYRAFQREISNTEASMRRYESQLQSMDAEATRFEDAQVRMRTYMEATGQSAADLSSTLGTRLSRAIADGSASTDQLEMALRRLGQQAGHSGDDLEAFYDALRRGAGSNNLDEVRRDLDRISESADEAKVSIKDMGSALGGAISGLATGEVVGSVKDLVEEMTEVNQALGMLQVQADKAGVSIEDIGAGKTALDSVKHDANQITEAMGNLIQAGYTTSDSINTISEALAGARVKYGETFNAEGLAESITTTTQLGEVTGQLTDLLEKEGVNVDDFNAKMQSLATVQERANYISDLLAKQGLNAMYQEYARLNPELISNSEATTSNQAALAELATQLTPLVVMVKDFATKIVEVITAQDGLAPKIVVIVAALGSLVTAFALLMPAIGGLVSAWPAIVAALGALTGPVGIAIAATIALGAAFALLWKNSQTFRDNMTKAFEFIKDKVSKALEVMTKFVGDKIKQIKDFWAKDGAQISKAAENIFYGIQKVVEFVMPLIEGIIKVVWGGITSVIDGALNTIMGAVKVFSSLFTGDFKGMWEGVKTIFKGAIDLIIGLMTLSFVGGIRSLIANFAKTAINLFTTKWTSIVGVFKNGGTNAVEAVKSMIGNMSVQFNTLKNNIINKVKEINLVDVGKDIIRGLIKGITSMTNAAIESMSGVVDGVVNKAKKMLGINSPSKLFKQFGEWTGEGYTIGLDKTIPDAERSSTNLADAVINAQMSLANSGLQSQRNQAVQQQVSQQSNNIDLNSLVAAITQLANQPVVVQSILDGRIISESVSRNQQQMYNLTAISKGVTT